MSLHRRNPKRDKSEAEIVLALQACGFTVARLSGANVPDLLLGKNSVDRTAEVKTGTAKLRKGQQAWADAWRGARPLVLRDLDDVRMLAACWPL